MKTATVSELKKELKELGTSQLVDLCLTLAKYKKDNKELLDYLLFEAHNKPNFILSVKKEIDQHFAELRTQSNLYYVKKSLRKLLRIINKYCKYVADKALAAELHIYFCIKLKESRIPYQKSQLLENLYAQEIKKIGSLIGSLHEDLQQDYRNDLEKILD